MTYQLTSDIETLAAVFADPRERTEAVSQLADCGVGEPSWVLMDPRDIARAIVKVFGQYEVSA